MSKYKDLEAELDKLIVDGDLLYYAMAHELGKLSEDVKKSLAEKSLKMPSFKASYDGWYSVALRLIKQVLPDRPDDFVLQYKNDKRKEVDYLTYTVSDYLLGLRTSRLGQTIVDAEAAIPKYERQLGILKSARKVFASSLTDLSEVLQADLFDSELQAAAELCKKGFVRRAGAIAGVVLERHLKHVCDLHGEKSRKKNPTINDFNEMLKKARVVDTAQWRFIQHLGDIRNLCDHPMDRDPTKGDVSELVEGVAKVTKTVF